MKLTKTERLVLANQYMILERLIPDEADVFQQREEIVTRGYTAHYAELDERFDDEMSVDECREVLDILDMFRAIAKAKRDGLHVNGEKLSFLGFDGNDESKQHGYVIFLVKTLDRYGELKSAELNSHRPTLERYLAMLLAWRATGEKYELTQNGVDAIASAV